jgi:hypothetical protein
MAAATTVADVYGQVAGEAAMRVVEAYFAGEIWAIEAFEKWKATGEAPVLKITCLEKVSEG